MDSAIRPIGVFDSGVGGLTVMKALMRELPNEDIIYFGDTARVPYGTKSKSTVTRFSTENVIFLMQHDVKLVVVACNTASSLSLDVLRRLFKIPILGVIDPGAQAACMATHNKRIGVIGTRATIQSRAYEKAIRRFLPEAKVVSESCPLFVPLVEEGWLGNGVASKTADIYLSPLKRADIDTLILGCTHYPLLDKVITKAMGNGIKLVDSATLTAKKAKEILRGEGMLNSKRRKAEYSFYVTDEPSNFIRLGGKFLGRPLGSVKKVQVNV